jgi:hypothetical protein
VLLWQLNLQQAPDIRVSWLAFEPGSAPIDVKVSWLNFDTSAGVNVVQLDANIYVNTSSFYSHVLTPGPVFLYPELFTNTNSVYRSAAYSLKPPFEYNPYSVVYVTAEYAEQVSNIALSRTVYVTARSSPTPPTIASHRTVYIPYELETTT